MKKKKSNAWFLNWHIYCLAYLQMAQIGLLELKEQIYRNKFNQFNQDDIYEDKIILIPIIWSLRHAIELLLKSIDARITKEFLQTHNATELHKEIKAALSSLGIKNSKYASDLSALSNKYLELKFWGNSLVSSSVIRDEHNDVFRYPESSVGFILSLENLQAASDKNLLELSDDLEQLRRLSLKLFSQVNGAKAT
jgi:hypothetical protein